MRSDVIEAFMKGTHVEWHRVVRRRSLRDRWKPRARCGLGRHNRACPPGLGRDRADADRRIVRISWLGVRSHQHILNTLSMNASDYEHQPAGALRLPARSPIASDDLVKAATVRP